MNWGIGIALFLLMYFTIFVCIIYQIVDELKDIIYGQKNK